MLLLASLTSWILFTLPIGFIQPPATSCVKVYNSTEFRLSDPQVPSPRIHKRSTGEENSNALSGLNDALAAFNKNNDTLKRTRRAAPWAGAGISPISVNYATNYNPKKNKNWVSPLFSSIVYTYDDIQKAFFLLFLLIVIGEFFSAPAITLADSAVITLLGENVDKYGHQRMFGSLGWGLAMFFVGIALDHSTAFPNHPCDPEKQEKNYAICFATFSVLMGAALLTATQITFKYDESNDVDSAEKGPEQKTSYEDDEMQNQLAEQLQLPSLAAGPRSGVQVHPERFAHFKITISL